MTCHARIYKAIFVAMIAALLLAGVLGLPHLGMSAEMHGEGHMTMSDCFMPGMAVVCDMNPLEHIASWQNMLTGAFTEGEELILLLLILVSVRLVSQLIHTPPDDRLTRLYRRRDYVPLHSPLQELFSGGILNPKVY